jgi:hypothetical protein
MKDKDHELVFEWIQANRPAPATSHQQFEQAFWHLWTLNNYHVTMSFDINMILLLDWALVFHMGER